MPSKNQVSLPGYFSEAPITRTEAILTHSRRGYRPNSRSQGSGSDREALLTRPLSMHTRLLSRVFCVWGGPFVLAYWLVVWLNVVAVRQSLASPFCSYT